MNKGLRLSLITFILVGGGNFTLADAIDNSANTALVSPLANNQETISSNKTITSNAYTSPTDITHTGGEITFGALKQTNTINNLNITTKNDKGRLWVKGDVYLNNVNISKENETGDTEHGLIVENSSTLTMLGGSLKNIAVNLGSSNGTYNDSIILDGVSVDNIKYGFNTNKDANFSILNSTIKDSEFNQTTSIINSTLKGDISGSISLIGSVDLSEAKLNLSGLNLIDVNIEGAVDNKTDLNTSGLITTSGNVTLDNIAVSKTNPLTGKSHHITLGNKSDDHDVNLNIINSNLTNTAINRYSKEINNSILTIDKSILTNVNFGNTDAGLDIVNITDSTINNTASGVSIDKGNFNITNSNITSTITGGTLNFKNSTITNSEFAGGTSYFENSKIEGVLKGGDLYVTNGNTYNVDIQGGRFITKGDITLNDYKVSQDTPLNNTRWNGRISIDNDTTLTLNNADFTNIQISSLNVNNKEALINNKLVINNSKITNTGIGSVNNAVLFVIDELELNNTNVFNDIQANTTFAFQTGIYASKININGGEITAPEIRTVLNTQVNSGNWDVNKLGTTTTINNAIINANVETETLVLKNNSVLNGDIQGTKVVKIENSQLNGNITRNDRGYCTDNGCSGEIEEVIITNSTIKGDINEVGNVSLTNTNLEASNVIVNNNITIDNSTSTEAKTITGNFQVGNDFTSKNTTFSGNITANNLLSDNKSTFQGNVSADSISAVGSTFEQTLTITGDSKNNVLDNATLEQGIVIDSKDAKVSVINGSEIKGEIINEGVINVEKGSTVSELVSGSGTLSTDGAWYDKNVSMGKIEGENNTFKGDVSITNTNTEVKADNNTFLGNVSVDNGKLSATIKNDFKDISANKIDFINDDVKTTDKITAQAIKVSDELIIKNIDVKANEISANKGTITNSNVFLNTKDTKVFLKGKDDNASSVYDKAEITSGDYTIEKSAIKGGIRADTLRTEGSKIAGQLAVNNLNATDSTFYITGGGYNTSLYEHFSGAIIARNSASGSNNIINISNTNLGMLVNGYVPIAIINNKAPNSTRADAIAAAPKVVNKDFFKVTYTTPISTLFLSPEIAHYTTIQDGDNTMEVWSVGLAGKELNAQEIQDIMSGKGNANFIASDVVDKNYQGYILQELFDTKTKAELNSIIYSPYYVAKNQAEILNDRFAYLRDDVKNHGFWVNNNYSFSRTAYNDLRYKGTSVGVDRNLSLDKFNLSYGAFANISRLGIDKGLEGSTNVRSFGAYASTNFYNGSFVDYSLAYATLKNKFNATKINLNNVSYTDLYQASITLGHRFSTKDNYLEPNTKIYLTKYKKQTTKAQHVSILQNQGAQVSVQAGVKAGVKLNKNFSLKSELNYYKDLNNSPKSSVQSMLLSEFDGLSTSGVNAKLGFLVKPNPKLDINADILKQISDTYDTSYKVNLGFTYKF